MILKAFCLMDSKVQAFHAPFFMAHVGHAIRACAELAQDRNTTVGRHPGDFILYEVGTFDDQTGVLRNLDLIVNHGPVLNFVTPQPELPMQQAGQVMPPLLVTDAETQHRLGLNGTANGEVRS